ncbi:hypothetical protein KBD71_02725, partial [Candidatus Woesebacteria bacterium]|nr:hypothetical protein [Candidatus Woesebacteria bacterium]
MPHSREIGERRQLGALALISNKRGEVLVFKDKSKVEVAEIGGQAQLEWWSQGKEITWGLPGGGRGNREDGSEETLQMTLENETGEELFLTQKGSHHRLPTYQSRLARQQAYPNVVAQRKDPLPQKPENPKDEPIAISLSVIHQFGVTSVNYKQSGLSENVQ